MNIFKILLNPTALYSYLKKIRIEKAYKENNLKIALFVSIHNCSFGKNNYLNQDVSVSNVALGDYSYINSGSHILNATIGKFCSIGTNVRIGLGKHPVNFVSTHPSFYSNNKAFKTFADKMYFQEYEKIIIENDVWIGNNAMIMDGVKIGTGAIISAGSIVTKDVLPYSIVGGIPAKLIRFRFSEEQIKQLLDSQWWNQKEEWFKDHFKSFHDINDFTRLIINHL